MRVLKFGGTSVADADAIRRVVAIVAEERRGEATSPHGAKTAPRGPRVEGPVVVVSALGGVTDQLLEVAALAKRGDAAHALALVDRLYTRHLETLASLAPGEHGGPVPEAIDALFSPAARDCRRRCGPARSVAPIARRHRRDRRAREQPARHRGAGRRRHAGDLGRSPRPHRDRRELHLGDAARGRDQRTDRRASPSRARRRPRDRDRRLRRRDPARHHLHARPRRLRLLGGPARRSARRRGDPDLDRRRRHAHGRSARRGLRAARAVPVVCRGRRARVLRREGAPPQDHPAGGGP